ncbi:unnamed protein product [Cyprideis torosa]|uniref:L-glutamate gamma-semialdehyde dehydrogenase n=1 Tax=Cyprideis torosa TaxID=163714 RepID=A0A7R8ZHD2_9CRUS|nr:unnamed protein product [Cyprideis torosa]CAG0883416.1 unnamed protein product [Cyprideis torosa]
MDGTSLEKSYVDNVALVEYLPGSPERKLLMQKLGEWSDKITDVPLVIGGKEFRNGLIRTQVCPHNHQKALAKFYYADEGMINKAILECQKARPEWERLHMKDRIAIFMKMADLCAGKYRQDLNAVTIFNAHFAQTLTHWQPISPDLKETKNSMRYRSLEGFVASICPFNFTAIGGNLGTAPTLMGNCTLWKPSDTACLSNYLIFKICEEAGMPPGVINFVPSDGPVFGKTIVSSPSLSAINFTGSLPTFTWLWQNVGTNLNIYNNFPRLVGEVGGKNYHFVLPDVDDLESVAALTIRSAFEYGGQKCSACSRLYVPQSLWKQLKKRMLDMLSHVKMGDPAKPEMFLGAVIDERAFDRIKSYLNFARLSSDCRILVGGNADKSIGFFIEPTIVETTNPTNKLMTEEIFGPLLTVYVYDDRRVADMPKLITNSTRFALTGAIFCKDDNTASSLMEQLRFSCGNFYINDKSTGSVVCQQPFGGGRMSGTNDKAGGPHYLLRFANPQAVLGLRAGENGDPDEDHELELWRQYYETLGEQRVPKKQLLYGETFSDVRVTSRGRFTPDATVLEIFSAAPVYVFLSIVRHFWETFKMRFFELVNYILALLDIRPFPRASRSMGPTRETFFPSDVGKVTWAHRVNSKDELFFALNGDAMMIEADILMGTVVPKKSHSEESAERRFSVLDGEENLLEASSIIPRGGLGKLLLYPPEVATTGAFVLTPKSSAPSSKGAQKVSTVVELAASDQRSSAVGLDVVSLKIKPGFATEAVLNPLPEMVSKGRDKKDQKSDERDIIAENPRYLIVFKNRKVTKKIKVSDGKVSESAKAWSDPEFQHRSGKNGSSQKKKVGSVSDSGTSFNKAEVLGNSPEVAALSWTQGDSMSYSKGHADATDVTGTSADVAGVPESLFEVGNVYETSVDEAKISAAYKDSDKIVEDSLDGAKFLVTTAAPSKVVDEAVIPKTVLAEVLNAVEVIDPSLSGTRQRPSSGSEAEAEEMEEYEEEDSEPSVLIPIMAHPPHKTSDLSFQEFIDRLGNQGRGIKLDFKDIEAVEPCLKILKEKESEFSSVPIWLNADIIRGPVQAREPLDGDRFLRLCKRYFPDATLSLGWTVRVPSGWSPRVPTTTYTLEHMRAMMDMLFRNDVSQPVTFPIWALFVPQATTEISWLLNSVPNSTLTIWGGPMDALLHNRDRLTALREMFGKHRVFYDLPYKLNF